MLLLLPVSNNNAQSDSSIHLNSFLICFQNINPNVCRFVFIFPSGANSLQGFF